MKPSSPGRPTASTSRGRSWSSELQLRRFRVTPLAVASAKRAHVNEPDLIVRARLRNRDAWSLSRSSSRLSLICLDLGLDRPALL